MCPACRPLGFLVTVAEPSCHEVIAVIQCYVDGECDLGMMMAVASHLDECDACLEELMALRWLKAAVRRCATTTRATNFPLWH